jgi:hypothetical protein
MEVNGQLHAPVALPQGKNPSYPLDKKLGGPQSPSGLGGEEKNCQPLPGLETPIIQPVAQRYTTELSQLPKLCLCFFKLNTTPWMRIGGVEV